MTFSRLHIMAVLGLAASIWILIQVFTGEAVTYEHFPLRPLD